jgi:hypothetical protein
LYPKISCGQSDFGADHRRATFSRLFVVFGEFVAGCPGITLSRLPEVEIAMFIRRRIY